MRYEYGDPGNPRSSLHGLNLSCRITRGKGQCVVDIADDQQDRALEHIDQMILWLEVAKHDLIIRDYDGTGMEGMSIDARAQEIRKRYRAQYQKYLDETA